MASSINVLSQEQMKINPELQKERNKASFNVQELISILDGGPKRTKRRKELEQLLFTDPVFTNPDRHFMSKSELYEHGVEKSVRLFQLKRKYQWSEDDYTLAERLLRKEISLSLHHTMFIPALERLATDEQKAKWLPLANSCRILGAYAQTELGHGTNILALETTATFNQATDEFILRTPHITSMKWWPGGLGKSCTHAIVLAQLIIHGKNYGLHPFLVQIRSLEDHSSLRGITVGDIGPKLAINTVDNGFLKFHNHHIPRDHMLMRNAKVSRDGKFVSEGNSKANYATMILVRVNMTEWAANILSGSVTIAMRYSCIRRQSSLKQGVEEELVINYQSQQYKLFPALASAYALLFTSRELHQYYDRVYPQITKGNYRQLGELHSQSSALKAMCGELAVYHAEICRRACGGHGYLWSAGIGEAVAGCNTIITAEGENTVLYQQTARYLMKQVASVVSGQEVGGYTAYLNTDNIYTNPINTSQHCRDLNILAGIYQNMAASVIKKTAHKLHHDMSSGLEQHVAWNNNMINLVKAAQVHSHLSTVLAFITSLDNLISSQPIKSALTLLCQFYAIYGITNNSGDFIETSSISVYQLELLRAEEIKLLSEIRPDAVALVDAFDIHDETHGSVLGKYDGNVYHHLYQSALREPLNKTDVSITGNVTFCILV
ncbi:hypothetical protein LOTGIDRAFT_105863 [Lottia gigantea]|uniref:Acyl-coenzyme A oxidase n=1 Tax=Lottia gigantea TaxID=225164 RepID=V3ZIZ3_LOTGI|nr:hypothetical protein LOTGIDRAFT_105863 [Lottia gigantea]ESO91273.1 hypothetical protein LOTGIDRAFT_105863 [Lottia gigantea]